MTPSEICKNLLTPPRLTSILDELTNPQLKAVLKQGSAKVKLPSGYVNQKKRREMFVSKILALLEQGNEDLASELLQEWLLHHRRALLVKFLDRLEVKHSGGETDETFLVARPVEKIRDAATWLLGNHDRTEAAAYLLYIAFQQRSSVFDDWDVLKARADSTPAASDSTPPAPDPAAP
jgi:hypothetical protein